MTSAKTTWIVAVLCLGMGWSTTGLARCTGAQISGIWEVAFSDGNSCRLRVVLGGNVDTEQSICYDPDRGTSALDSGSLPVNVHCFAEGELVIGGVTVELPIQFSANRDTAAGRYRIPASGDKGMVVLVREP